MLFAMSGRHPKAMRPRDERAHPVIQDAHAKGYLDSGRDYLIPGLASHGIANDVRMSVRRGLQHLGFGQAARVVDMDGIPCWKDCRNPAAPHGVTFKLWSKDGARQHVFQESRGDVGKLKFNPYQKASPRLVDDSGRPV